MDKMFSNVVDKKAGISLQLAIPPAEQNKLTSNQSDFSLPRSKILRGKRNFQRLFEKGTALNSTSLQFKYRIYDNPDEQCLVGFIAPKRQFKRAVDRNRTKRLLREAYRLNQHYLQSLFDQHTFGFHGVFIATKKLKNFSMVESEMIPLLEKAQTRLLRITDNPSSSTPQQK